VVCFISEGTLTLVDKTKKSICLFCFRSLAKGTNCISGMLYEVIPRSFTARAD
jgi:hypothetical protein